jgi:hypothetical protein
VPRSMLAPHAGCPREDPAVRGTVSLCLHLFLAQVISDLEIVNRQSEFSFACVAEQQST